MFNTRFNRIIYCLPENAQRTHGELISNLKELYADIEILYGLPTAVHVYDALPKLIILGKTFC